MVLSTRRRRAVRLQSGLRVPFSLLLFCLVSTSLSAGCPVSFKGPRSSCQLVFHQFNGGPILCCLSSREGIVHLRRGLHPLRYHLHARRGRSSGQMRATTELIGLARRIPSTRSAACRVLSDGGLLLGCFQLATSSWLTSPLVCTAATKPSSGLHDGRKAHQDRRYRQLQLRGSVTRFLLVEEAQHRLPSLWFLYLGWLCYWHTVGNRVAFHEGGCVVHLKSAHPAATC